jgi:hypothetical protein
MGGSSSVISQTQSQRPSIRHDEVKDILRSESKEYHLETSDGKEVLPQFSDNDIIPTNPFRTTHDSHLLNSLCFIPFENLKHLGKIPSYREDKQMLTSLADFTEEMYDNSILIFVSHSLHYQPKYEENYYQLCVEGIQRMQSYLFPDGHEIYLWFDYGCTPSIPSSDFPFAYFPKLIQIVDFLFTPVYDASNETTVEWQYLSDRVHFPLYSHYETYQSREFQDHYLTNGWNRLFMVYAHALPLLECQLKKRKKINYFSSQTLEEERPFTRPHILYGRKEHESNHNHINNKTPLYPFLILPPLKYCLLDHFHPMKASGFTIFPSSPLSPSFFSSSTSAFSKKLSKALLHNTNESKAAAVAEDKEEVYQRTAASRKGSADLEEQENEEGCKRFISQQLKELSPVLLSQKRKLKVGYEGETVDHLRHGEGKSVYENGDCYLGTFYESNKHGKGGYYFLNGDILEGTWQQGALVGKSLLTLSYGKKIILEWSSDANHEEADQPLMKEYEWTATDYPQDTGYNRK